jgi:peptide/nickel transport system permease protein
VVRVLVQRLLLLPLLLVVFSVLVFALVQAPPGGFLTSYVSMLAASGSSIDAAQVEALRRQFGLDQPFHIQYIRWVQNLLRGDLGLSLEY